MDEYATLSGILFKNSPDEGEQPRYCCFPISQCPHVEMLSLKVCFKEQQEIFPHKKWQKKKTREFSLGHNDLRFTSCNRDPLPVLFPEKKSKHAFLSLWSVYCWKRKDMLLSCDLLDLLISTSQSWCRATVVVTPKRRKMHIFKKSVPGWAILVLVILFSTSVGNRVSLFVEKSVRGFDCISTTEARKR